VEIEKYDTGQACLKWINKIEEATDLSDGANVFFVSHEEYIHPSFFSSHPPTFTKILFTYKSFLSIPKTHPVWVSTVS